MSSQNPNGIEVGMEVIVCGPHLDRDVHGIVVDHFRGDRWHIKEPDGSVSVWPANELFKKP